jgi:hypothetical protein
MVEVFSIGILNRKRRKRNEKERKRERKKIENRKRKREVCSRGRSFVCSPVFPIYSSFTVEIVKSPWVLCTGGMGVSLCDTWLKHMHIKKVYGNLKFSRTRCGYQSAKGHEASYL